MNNKQIGKTGEEIAKKYLEDKGFDILETNYRFSKISEIDIIASKDNILHFVEVKTRTSTAFGYPTEAISKAKLNSIYKCAKFYLSNTKNHYKEMRIDAISIILNNEANAEIDFIENISLN